MDEPTLKPCPFCGCPEIINADFEGADCYACTGCGASCGSEEPGDGRTAWNSRAHSDTRSPNDRLADTVLGSTRSGLHDDAKGVAGRMLAWTPATGPHEPFGLLHAGASYITALLAENERLTAALADVKALAIKLDAVKAADEALAQSEQNGWQPIESAPKNNKQPLYLARIDESGKIQQIDLNGSWESESESWEIPQVYYFWSSDNGIEEPTHWAYQDGPPPAQLGQRGEVVPIKQFRVKGAAAWNDGIPPTHHYETRTLYTAPPAPVGPRPINRWPFVESPGAFAVRMAEAMRDFGDTLPAVRNVLIENPPTLSAEYLAALAAAPEVKP